jgi:hypothetical protein
MNPPIERFTDCWAEALGAAASPKNDTSATADSNRRMSHCSFAAHE